MQNALLRHPTALIHPDAQLHPTVFVGPYCIVGPQVRVGAHTRLHAHVVLEGPVELGENNQLYPFCCLGQPAQVRGENMLSRVGGRLVVGDFNIIREYVTLHRGSEAGRGETRLGSRCYLMVSSHVAHDCDVGDEVVMANGVSLAGHVEVAGQVTFGGLAGIHQGVRVGRLSMVAAGAMVSQDVPPFCLVQGDRARLRGLNLVGLRRAGFSSECISGLKRLYRQHFLSRGGGSRSEAAAFPEGDELLEFVRRSHRGVCTSRV
ncbi:MAG: acyl-ACP--UDP-N-acetylglucosamine O-acyltransferase [Myxococcota bacterium]